MRARDRLASALGRSDERPNVELAEALAARPDRELVAEFAELLSTGTVADDCASPRCNRGGILERRLQTIEQPAKRARVEKVLRKLVKG